MPLYTLPKRLHPDFSEPGRKPVGPVEVDWDNPLTRGLTLFMMNERELVKNNVLEQIGSPVAGVNLGRRITNFGDETQDYGLVAPPIGDHTELTVLCSTRPNEDAAGNYFISSTRHPFIGNVTAANKGWTYQVRGATGGSPNPGKQSFVFNGVAEYDSTSFDLSGEDFQQHGVTAKNSDTIDFYINGAFMESVACGTMTTPSGEVCIGHGAPKTSPSYEKPPPTDGEYYAIWNRVLSAEEIKSFYEDPYQILKPAVPITYFLPEAAAAAATGISAYTLPKRFHPDFAIKGRKPVGAVVNQLRGDVWLFTGNEKTSAKGSTFTTASTTTEIRSSPFGRALYDDNFGAVNTAPFTSAKLYAFVWDVYITNGSLSSATTGNIMVQFKKTGGSALYFGTHTGFITGETITLSTSEGGTERSGIGTALAEGEHYKICMAWLNGAYEFFINGQAITRLSSSADVSTLQTVDTLQLTIDRGNTYPRPWCISARVVTEQISAAQALELSANPYAYLEPAVPMTYFVPGAAVGGGFQPAWAHNSNTIIQAIL